MYSLANIKSAKKRILVNRTKAERNKSIRSAVKTAIKKAGQVNPVHELVDYSPEEVEETVVEEAVEAAAAE